MTSAAINHGSSWRRRAYSSETRMFGNFMTKQRSQSGILRTCKLAPGADASAPQPKEAEENRKKFSEKKTYNTGDSLVVTDPTTSPALRGLSSGEQTGPSVLHELWPYVVASPASSTYQRRMRKRYMYARYRLGPGLEAKNF